MTYSTRKLGEIILENKKSTLKSRGNSEGRYPFYVSGSKIKSINSYLVDGENIFLSTGGHFVVHFYNGKSAYSTDTFSIKSASGVDIKYLYYFLDLNQEEINNKMFKGATIRHLQKKELREMKIPFPPLSEQKKIVVKLESLLAKISEAKKLRVEARENADNLLSAELHKIFEKGKKKGWEEARLEDVSNSVADGTHDTPKYCDQGYPLVTSKNLRPEGLSFETAKFISEEDYIEINKRSHVSNGDILIGMIGTIGNITKVNTERKFSIKNVGLIRPDNKKVLADYLIYYLDNSRLFTLINTGGTTQKFISLGALRDIKIKYPSLVEQKKIVARLDSISQKVGTVKELQDKTDNEFSTLESSVLSKAFSGNFTS
jgi:type I restriction enzyme, S subunit